MTIETAGIPSRFVAEYAAVPIAFEVKSVLSAEKEDGGSFVLTEHPLDHPYVKDYDAVSDRPEDWADRFDTSQWRLFLARDGGQCVGGAAVTVENDLAGLWDIRVAPSSRGRGVGRALFGAAETWARARGCRELKVETQNVNVPACRFYAAMGCHLRAVRSDAYPECPGEVQFLWSKALELTAALNASGPKAHTGSLQG